MASIITNRFFYLLATKQVDLVNDTIKAAILDSTYVPDKDHNVWADVSAKEVSGAGYTSGGQTLANKSVTEDDVNDKVVFDADDLLWPNVTFTGGKFIVIYDDTLVTKDILKVYEMPTAKSPAADDFQVNVNVLGLLSLAQV